MKKWPPSRQLLVFCLSLLAGVAVGMVTSWSLGLLIFLTVSWLAIYISGQKPEIELLSLVAGGFFAGVLLFGLTGGDSWLHLRLLDQASDVLINWRDLVVARIFLALPEPHGSLLSGIIFGNKVKLSKDLVDQFKVIGVTHLIAVSGYNLTILTANVRSIFRPILGLKSFYLCLVAILGFVLMTGAPASVLRAAVMSGLFLLAEFLGRPSRSINILIVGAAALVIFEPSIITDVGFQLSLAATYGLLRLSPVISYALRNLPIPKTLTSIISETLGATVLTTPIILFYFERISLISPIANLLILPIVPLLMGVGIFGAVILMIFQALGRGAIMLAWPALEWIVYLSNKLSALKFASTNLSVPSYVVVLIILLILIGCEYLFNKLSQIEEENVARLA